MAPLPVFEGDLGTETVLTQWLQSPEKGTLVAPGPRCWSLCLLGGGQRALLPDQLSGARIPQPGRG